MAAAQNYAANLPKRVRLEVGFDQSENVRNRLNRLYIDFGIAIALVTTEQGLMVAIPCLLLGSMLNGWAESIKDDMEKAALKIVNLYQDGKRALARAAA